MDDSVLIALAQGVAVGAHAGQTDKLGCPYILHPMAVSLMLQDAGDVALAWLHDVVEDTDVTLDELRWIGFPEDLVLDVARMTHAPGEPRVDYIARVMESTRAVRVKRADINHNRGRIAQLPDAATRDRLTKKYNRDLALLDG